MRIIANIERGCPSPASKIERLFRVHRQGGHAAVVENTGRVIIAGFVELTVTDHYVVGRGDRSRSITSQKLGCRRPRVVLALTKINITDSTRHSPNIGVEIARAARDSGILIVKGFAEGSRAAQLHAAVSANRGG